MIVDIEANELSLLDRILIPMRIKEIIRDEEGIFVTLENGEKLSYRDDDTILVQIIRGR